MPASGTQTSKRVALSLAPAIVASQQTVLRRKCACGQHAAGGECEECKKKKESGEFGDPLLRRSALGRRAVGEVPSSVHSVMRYAGRPLDGRTRTRLESSFHCDLSKVRVHTDESAARAASEVNARAFALGQNIWFGRNEYSPRSAAGFHLLAHEVAHTIQQGTESPLVQRSLSVGAVDDPAEAAADRAADAALRSSPMLRLTHGEAIIRRVPDGKFPSVKDLGPDEKLVSLDEHKRYHIKRTAVSIRHTANEPAPPSVGVGANFAKAWVRVEWCQDSVRGQVDVGVDVTQQLQTLIPKLLQAVTTKGDVESVLKGATVTPYLDVLVAKSGNWQLNVKVETDVGRGGPTAERGSIKLHTQWFDLSGNVSVTQTQRGSTPSGSVTITIPLEKPPKKFQCKDKQKEWWEQSYLYECTKEKEPSPPKGEPPAAQTARDREIFFCWAKADLNEGKCAPGPLDKGKESADSSAKAAAANKQALQDLRKDFSDGYQVTGVTGYTSPEGPAGPLGQFEGNKVLADERGAKAVEIAGQTCFPRRTEICIPGGVTGVKPANGGSLPGSAAEYPLLRKATLHLAPPSPKQKSEPEKPVDLNISPTYQFCPPEVIELAFPKQSSKKE